MGSSTDRVAMKPQSQTPAVLPPQNGEKVSFRKTPVPCKICSLPVIRRDMEKHLLAVHSVGPVTLITKTATQSENRGLCLRCGKKNAKTWRFPKTSRGPVQLCKRCRTQCLAALSPPKHAGDKRIDNLKATLHEISGMLANPAYASMHPRLKEQVKELESSLKTPSYGHRWSPILPGSYGSGSRR